MNLLLAPLLCSYALSVHPSGSVAVIGTRGPALHTVRTSAIHASAKDDHADDGSSDPFDLGLLKLPKLTTPEREAFER